jgi:dienelactone hydrolase
MRQLFTPAPLLRAALVLLLVLPGLAVAAGPPRPSSGGGTLDSFVSGGKRVPVERFQPARPGKYPVVLLLHGLEGPEFSGLVFRSTARRLAQKGFVALVVRYFERTGTRPRDALALRKQFQDHLRNPHARRCPPGLREHFAAWKEAVRDAVRYARALPGADPSCVGLVGFSLGGYLATSAAAEADLEVACVVELFGGLPREDAATLKRLPPTLILHGERDRMVPVQEAYALRDLLQAKKLEYEAVIYPGVDHGFRSKDGKVAWLAALHGQGRAFAFLSKHLQTPRAARCGKGRTAVRSAGGR